MKKWKLYASIAVLVLVVVLLAFGIIASVMAYNGVANRTEFITGDENVFVRINAEYFGPDLSSGSKTFSYEINRNNENSFDQDKIAIPTWNLGKTNFIAHSKETISFVFKFENLNSKNDLNVTMSNIAVDFDEKFITQYYIYDIEPNEGIQLEAETVSINNASIPTLTIPKSSSKMIKVEFTLKSYAEDFEFANNMKVLFETPTTQN